MTIIGEPITLTELAGIIQRIQSGESSLEEECVRNLDSFQGENVMKFGLKFKLPFVSDADRHDVSVIVDGQEVSRVNKTYPGDAKETTEMEFNAGNTVSLTIVSKSEDGKVLETQPEFKYTITDDELPKQISAKRMIKAAEAAGAANPDSEKGGEAEPTAKPKTITPDFEKPETQAEASAPAKKEPYIPSYAKPPVPASKK